MEGVGSLQRRPVAVVITQLDFRLLSAHQSLPIAAANRPARQDNSLPCHGSWDSPQRIAGRHLLRRSAAQPRGVPGFRISMARNSQSNCTTEFSDAQAARAMMGGFVHQPAPLWWTVLENRIEPSPYSSPRQRDPVESEAAQLRTTSGLRQNQGDHARPRVAMWRCFRISWPATPLSQHVDRSEKPLCDLAFDTASVLFVQTRCTPDSINANRHTGVAVGGDHSLGVGRTVVHPRR